MDIGIDFDGTCVEHDYPDIGNDVPLAVDTLKELVKNGHRLILNTMRSNNHPGSRYENDKGLDDAVNWFKERDIPLYGIQRNPDQDRWTHSPKVYAQLYIDDAALGCPLFHFENKRPFVDWYRVVENLRGTHLCYVQQRVVEVLISDDFYNDMVRKQLDYSKKLKQT